MEHDWTGRPTKGADKMRNGKKANNDAQQRPLPQTLTEAAEILFDPTRTAVRIEEDSEIYGAASRIYLDGRDLTKVFIEATQKLCQLNSQTPSDRARASELDKERQAAVLGLLRGSGCRKTDDLHLKAVHDSLCGEPDARYLHAYYISRNPEYRRFTKAETIVRQIRAVALYQDQAAWKRFDLFRHEQVRQAERDLKVMGINVRMTFMTKLLKPLPLLSKKA